MSANDVVGTLTRSLKEIHLDDSELDDRTVIGESELVRRYDEINAKTMYNMMEEIGDQRLFFLTNQQADLLAESEASIDRLIKALELPKEPKLVIILHQRKIPSAFSGEDRGHAGLTKGAARGASASRARQRV